MGSLKWRARAARLVLGFSVALALVLPAAVASAAEPASSTGGPGWDWPSVTPESEGFFSGKLAEALEAASAAGIPIHSLLLTRHGSVFLDATFYPYDDGLYHDVASVTKSVLTTLVGIAADRGELDLDAPVVSFFPDRTISDREAKEGITVRHLASMTSGFACDHATGSTQAAMRASEDWAGFVLDLPLAAEPGSTFTYCDPGLHLLSAVLTEATGRSAADYAQEVLFEPLGIQDVYWPTDPQGITHGWGDLALHPRDMARLGQLFLQGGRWGDEQIVSGDWVSQATTAVTGTGKYEDYGYGWWVSPADDEIPYFAAEGNEGQRIQVFPALDLVVVTTGGGFDPGDVIDSLGSAASPDLGPLPEDPAGVAALDETLGRLKAATDTQPVPDPPAIAGEVSGRTYELEENALGLRSVAVDLDGSAEATFTLGRPEEGIARVDRVGLDGRWLPSLAGRPIVARGGWTDDRTFTVQVDEGPGLHAYDVALAFDGDGVVLTVMGQELAGQAVEPAG